MKASKASHNSSLTANCKRMRMTSSSNSDTGLSLMSTYSRETRSDDWPSLVLLSKPDEKVCNGRNRKRFPDPVRDRSVLLACFDSQQSMVKKLRHCTLENRKNKAIFNSILKERIPSDGNENVKQDNKTFFISLDDVGVCDKDNNPVKNTARSLQNIMLVDVRDHKVASECLPGGVSGYWVRIFGEQCKFTLHLSLWKTISSLNNCKPLKRNDNDKHLMKIGELLVDLNNTGLEHLMKKRRKKKRPPGMLTNRFIEKNLTTTDYTPMFCSREQYVHITTSLRELVENGKVDLFHEMYDKLSLSLRSENRNDRELKSLLDCELSLMYSVQGKYSLAKKLLQNVVENVIPKSPNKIFILNRGYLSLAYTHTIEGNYGTAEDCLNVLHMDRKNGMPFEDVGCFYYLYAVIMLNFAKSLHHLSDQLCQKASLSLEKAITNFKKQPNMFNMLCRAQLCAARLEIFQKKISCTDFPQTINIKLSAIESYGIEKLSEHTKCFYNVVRTELMYKTENFSEAQKMLQDTLNHAQKFSFAEEIRICESFQNWWNSKEYDEFITSIEIDDGEESNNLSQPTDHYSADQSSI